MTRCAVIEKQSIGNQPDAEWSTITVTTQKLIILQYQKMFCSSYTTASCQQLRFLSIKERSNTFFLCRVPFNVVECYVKQASPSPVSLIHSKTKIQFVKLPRNRKALLKTFRCWHWCWRLFPKIVSKHLLTENYNIPTITHCSIYVEHPPYHTTACISCLSGTKKKKKPPLIFVSY